MNKTTLKNFSILLLLLIAYVVYGISSKQLCFTYGSATTILIVLLIVYSLISNKSNKNIINTLSVTFIFLSILTTVLSQIIFNKDTNISSNFLMTGIIGISVSGILLIANKISIPNSPESNIYKITYPKDLSSDNQKVCDNMLETLYPLMKNPSKDLWKTLDFFYSARKLTSDNYASNDQTAIGYPTGGQISDISKVMLNYFRQQVPSNKRSLNENFERNFALSYVANLLDVVAYPFTEADQNMSVDGYLVNRFDPDDLFGKNIAFCKTGTHNGEFAIVDQVKGVSAYYLGVRGDDGEIEGFKDNMSIEIIHIYTHNTPDNVGGQFFDITNETFGDYLYYARGSGVFFNPGKVLNARNKIDAMRIALHYSKMTPTVSGWNDSSSDVRGDQSKDSNKYYKQCPNTFNGYLNLVKMWGTDKEITLLGDGSSYTLPMSQYPDFVDKKPLSCTERGYSYGGNTGFWCPGLSIAKQYYCCMGKGGDSQCKQGMSEGSFLSRQDDDCNQTTSVSSEASWRLLEKIIPDKLPDGTSLDTDENKLAWLLYTSCNGTNKTSGEFANPWSSGKQLTTKQKLLLTHMVAWMANVGSIGDDAYIVPMKYTALDNNGKRLFDTCIMQGQPEASGCLAVEIMTLFYNGTPDIFFTENPQSNDKTVCKYLTNPGMKYDYDKTGQPCKDELKDCKASNGIQGVCVGNPSKCAPPSVLSCDNVSWATPILSFPVWPNNKKAPFDITSGHSPTEKCDVESSQKSDCGKDLQAHTFPYSCTNRGCCFKQDSDGPWCYCPSGKTFDDTTKTCK